MDDQGNERDDQKEVNHAPREVECRPTKEPGDKEDDKQDQKPGEEHGDLLFSLLRFDPSIETILLGRQPHGSLC
jgi:hypothetical protein